jgi:hypothetical protein
MHPRHDPRTHGGGDRYGDGEGKGVGEGDHGVRVNVMVMVMVLGMVRLCCG